MFSKGSLPKKYHKGKGYKFADLERKTNLDALKNAKKLVNNCAKSKFKKIKVFVLV